MKWLPDYTRRFAKYPFYESNELDDQCESMVADFLLSKRGTIAYPISTDELSVLVETFVADLDWCCDLSIYGEDVEGITHFAIAAKPRVEISNRLSAKSNNNRFRMTLAHELAHVRFHNCLYQLSEVEVPLLPLVKSKPLYCKREAIAGATKSDWMEWQAAYGGGAILMPASAVRGLVSGWLRGGKLAVHPESGDATDLCTAVAQQFEVSRTAARVRLEKLGLLSRNLQFEL